MVTMADTPSSAPASYTLYESRKKIQTASVKGRFRTIKWAILVGALAIYYLLPFIRWDRGPHAPSQAVLLDLANERFYFFFIEIWPQEVYYITGLLILAAFSLFLMNAVAGRIWCGYLCPQTVWTDLFMAVERLIEGDRRERLKLDAAPWSLEKFTLRLLKHSAWLLIAWWTGGAWVLYFADAPTLVYQLATFQAPPVAYAAILILTFTTYTLAGLMREQVCTYMCPWPRIQAALTDEQALNITYRYDRGEPRGSTKKNAALKTLGKPAGECVDCFQCVHVCPMGIDIRDGLQMECIQCGLCIDACDNVMTKIGRPTGLIAYDTELNVKRRQRGEAPVYKLLRARTVLYALLIAGVGLAMLTGLALRSFTGISVLHDRNPLYVTLADGSIRNGYTIRVLNKRPIERTFTISAQGLDGARLEIAEGSGADKNVVTVGPDRTDELRVLVFAPAGAKLGKSTPIRFRIDDVASHETAGADDYFKAP
jgi:cytochrome c oxidase accessory protein FixG